VQFDRLRLLGFKSFVEPTELHIEPGLTGVVGPNGCGKSNLVEALRWVMGETSAKSLRGTGMEDVIFAGTAGRSARNHAEVTLSIDNTERRAPAQFNDADRLEVVRRIERDAGSAYRVNGKDCRMRDVQLLFADMSSGAHSTAMVRQGQIGQLINAKPQARRMILEEAAGISGLHSRRHEAELKLRAAETNLTRLDDVLQQIEGQLASLKRQARQATRYRNLSGHIRSAEAITLHLKWTAAKDTVAAAQARLEEIETEVAQLTEESAKASRLQYEASEKLPPLREAEAAAAAALHRLTVERDNLQAEENRAAQEAERLATRLAQIEQDGERERTRIEDGEAQLQRLSEEEAELKAAAEGQEDAVALAKQKVEDGSAALKDREGALETATSDLAQIEARRQSLERQIADLRSRRERAQRRLEESRSEKAKLEEEAKDLILIEDAQAGLDQARAEADAREAAAQEAETARKTAQSTEQTKREDLRQADGAIDRLKAEAKTLRDMLKVGDDGLWPKLIDAIQAQAGYETALGAALGDDLEAPTDRAAPIHWDDLPPLDTDQRLPEGVPSLAEFVRAPTALARRLSQIGVVSAQSMAGDAGHALQVGLKPGQRLVTREGDLWRWDGYVAAAGAPTAAAQRLEQRNRLADLESEIEAKEADARAVRETYHAARLAAEQAAQAESEARTAAREAQGLASQARDRLAEAEKTATRHQSRLTSLQDALQSLEGDLIETDRAIEEAVAALEATGDGSELKAAILDLREEVAGLRAQTAEDRAAAESIQREAAARDRRLAEIVRERSAWEERLTTSRAQVEDYAARLEDTRSELEKARAVPLDLQEKRKALLSAIADAETKRTEAAETLAEAETTLKEAEKHHRDVTEALSSAREVRAREQATIEGAEARVVEMGQRIEETLEVEPHKALSLADLKEGEDLPPLEEIEKKLERYKREREGMGAVNLRADEEAQEYQERLDSMNAEREDLIAAIARLRQGIQSLNKEGRERLLAAFDTVNGHFQRLFTTLFGGGEAKLELVESDDPLEAGLEILARPPGKKLQSMTLLSGGEQALTAMSLIFAVFLSNPAPLCVLDEVDAPLDDTNVDRFCNLLDEMAKLTNTRFIIITHHAITMSRMDRLYGVTMAERGVSQLVSVDLARAEEVIAAE